MATFPRLGRLLNLIYNTNVLKAYLTYVVNGL